MQRREFCKLVAAAAAATAVPSGAAAEAATPLQAQGAAVPAEAPGFNHLTQHYAEFCATPANERVFYALVNGSIVEQETRRG